jgi:hypothetical protein
MRRPLLTPTMFLTPIPVVVTLTLSGLLLLGLGTPLCLAWCLESYGNVTQTASSIVIPVILFLWSRR